MRKSIKFCDRWHGKTIFVTLKQGEMVYDGFSRDTEEGFSAGGVSWWFSGSMVFKTVWTNSQDCDGAHGSNTEFVCKVECLHSEMFQDIRRDPADGWVPVGKPVKVPAWGKPTLDRVHDAFAEKAGY